MTDGDDLLSVLGNATIGGRPLTNSELAHNGLLYVAGGGPYSIDRWRRHPM